MSQTVPPQLEGQVTAPNPLELFWEQHRKLILTVGFVVLAAVAAYYLKERYDTEQRNIKAAYFHEVTGLDRLITNPAPSRMRQFTELDLDVSRVNLSQLDAYIADEARGTPYEPWALWAAANAHLVHHNAEAAEARLRQLKASFPDHILCAPSSYPPQVRTPADTDKDSKDKKGKQGKKEGKETDDEPELAPPLAGSPVDRLLETIARNREFREQHPSLFEATEPDGPVVELLLGTTKVTVRLYKEAAPEHVQNFVKLVKDGFYNGQRVYRIQRDPQDSQQKREPQLLYFGLAKTKETDDITEWDRAASESSQTLLDFPTNKQHENLSFFPGMLAAQKEKDGKTSGERLFLTANDCASSLDGDYVILGKVVGGLKELQLLLEGTSFSSGDEAKAGIGRPGSDIEISASVVE